MQELAQWLRALQAASLIEGVTFSGGEPTHQIGELLELAERLRGGVRDLSVGMFSGYSEQELQAGSYWTRDSMDRTMRAHRWSELQGLLDFAVLGRFNLRLPTRDPLGDKQEPTTPPLLDPVLRGRLRGTSGRSDDRAARARRNHGLSGIGFARLANPNNQQQGVQSHGDTEPPRE